MEKGRRDFMKIGAAAALGALLPSGADRAEAEARGTPKAPSAPAPLRILTFVPKPGAAPRTGVLAANGRIVDLGAAAAKLKKKLSFDPARMVSLIAAGEPALAEVRALLTAFRGEGPLVEDVRLLAPIPDPVRNVFAVGWNYVEHFEEGKDLRDANQALPEHPVFFTKATHVVNGPYDSIPFDPSVSTSIDWEGELAVVIGRHGRNIPEEKALDFVFGFSVINDTTARDLQQKKHGGQWFKGKSLDGHGPMGLGS
jgi:2-keto-4-pentenoate hydratase/2-oxohepta-3-ene-1,7-dioic acid hydratase in catechol pathway